MRLPNPIPQLKPKQKVEKEYFLSLLLDVHSVCAAAWQVGRQGTADIAAVASVELLRDAWEDRLQATDRIITKLEETVGSTNLHKVIFGLPAAYLTETGDILKSIRPHIKQLTAELELEAMGFVPNFQAIVHLLKHTEGVPPSVILLGVSGPSVTVSIYKVGAAVGHHLIKADAIVTELEGVLKAHTDMELLPSRILLYGINEAKLEAMKRDLLKHPWQNKVNFMHFPKIEVLPKDTQARGVSFAGASELSTTIGETEPEDAPVAAAEVPETVPESAAAPETPDPPAESQDEDPVMEAGEADVAVDDTDETDVPADAANVVMVDPEALGFQKHADSYRTVATPLQKKLDVGTAVEDMEDAADEAEDADTGKGSFLGRLLHRRPQVTDAAADEAEEAETALPSPPAGRRAGVGKLLPLVVLLIVILSAVLGAFYLVLPRAEITVYAIPRVTERSDTVTIDPETTSPDASAKVIPGRLKEQVLSGEKTIPVTGKKKVGTPAKGTITIFNKSLTSKSLRKGQVVSSGSLQFTLNSDVEVASASENLVSGTVTFGKANADITASAIGTESNLPSGTEFTFKDIASNLVVARNDQALAGGTSRDITVVSRADQDNLVKALSAELVERAKQELGSNVSGAEKLIDATIKTAVTDKSFTQELDQETSELAGKVTVTVSGIAYSEDDGKSLLTSSLSADVPPGYTLMDGKTSITISSATVKKDGTITVSMQGKALAIPQLDVQTLQKNIVGKNLVAAQEYLKSVNGVGGVTFTFRRSPFTDRLPGSANNISLAVTVLE